MLSVKNVQQLQIDIRAGIMQWCMHITHWISYCRYVPYRGKVWQIDSFRAFGERKFGELIDQPIDHLL